MTQKRLEDALKNTLDRGEKAFIPYIMAGDGGLERLKQDLLFFQEAGATAIELGIPFSDPVADGPVIQRAGERALKNGTTLRKIIRELVEIRDIVTLPVILMTYLNPVFTYGVDQFAKDCGEAGVSGCIIPDLPLEESGLVSGALQSADVALIQLVSLTSPQERIKQIADSAEGFLYAVTIKGITGARKTFEQETGQFLQAVKLISNVPVLAGFGISAPEHVAEAGQHCDGVVVGSKIVEHLQHGDYESIKTLIKASKEPLSI
ncbi:tryptophan synthase subunit alpha [Peribacillus sp. SCS-155]|uniref:tryptophan synthase subunit alpha n=1 Tax=Peribacillus sedimenti TaxID=3115297 RepID=UPI0039065791